MSHLSPERLASLTDDTPTPIEAAHITTCDACTDELAAHRRLARIAVESRADYAPPLSNFATLAPRLRAEGIIEAVDRRAAIRHWALRAAAAVAFLLVGAAAGRMSADGSLAALGVPSVAGIGAPAGTAQPVAFATQDEAMQAMMVSQQTYQNAAAFLAAQDTAQRFIGLNSDSYRTRLTALDEMAAASRTALYRAPQDPLLNQYYLALQTAREQTLQALAVSLPNTRQLGRY